MKTYICLILALAVSNSIQILLPSYQSLIPGTTEFPAPIWVIALINAGIAIVLYGALGLIGLMLSKRLGFAEIWDKGVSNRQRFLTPGILGVVLGIVLIIGDIIFSRFNGIGRLAHPPFPSSIFASLSAGIGEEIMFRLFFISFWVWIISCLTLKGRRKNQVFWIITIIAALAFAAGHIPSFMLLYSYKSASDIPPMLILESFLLNGIISIFAAYYMRKNGFLAAACIHFWTDMVWHVLWGVIA